MTIAEHLTKVDYSFDNYQPSKEAIQFGLFIKMINGGKEENETPLVHCMMLDKMVNNSSRVAIMASRGLAKSSLIEYLVLYLACFEELGSIKKPTFMMYIADSIENGVKRFRSSLELKYANSSFLQEVIPNKNIKYLATDAKNNKEFELSSNDLDDINNAGRSITDVKITFINKNGTPLCIRNYGIKTGIRGTREFGVRPSLAFLDDLLKEEDARSDTILASIDNIIYQSIPYALHPTKQKMIWVGTPFNEADPLYKSIESGRWDSLVLPICEKFPCAKEEFKGAWEDRFDYEVVNNFYQDALAKGNANGFYQELMMQVISDEQLLIKKEHINYIDNEILSKVDTKSFNYYITTDFAVSEKTSSDYSVISVWAYTPNEDFVLVDGYCGKQSMDFNIKTLFQFCAKYKPLQVGIEVTGQQAGFVSWIMNEQYNTKIYFDIKQVRPAKDKFSRFLAFATMYHRNKVKIYLGMKNNEAYHTEYINEITKVSKTGFKSKHDDILDTNSMLLDLDLYAPNGNISLDDKNTPKRIYSYFDKEFLQDKNENDIIPSNNLIF